MRPAIPPPPDEHCTVCNHVGHLAVAHWDADEAALVWSRSVLVIARYRLEGGARLLMEEMAMRWSDAAFEMMRRG